MIYLQCLHLISFYIFFYFLQKRQILVTVIEICLPLLFAAILIALRHRVHSISHPNATVYPPESVDDLPGFFYRRHPSNPWELAYVPSNSSAVRSIAEAVERALPISIRGEQGQGAQKLVQIFTLINPGMRCFFSELQSNGFIFVSLKLQDFALIFDRALLRFPSRKIWP